MNNKQKTTVAVTAGTALAADALIGGIGLAIGGTAIGIPAAAVVATVGAASLFFMGDDAPKPTNKTTSKSHKLTKGNVTYTFIPDSSTNTGKSFFLIKGKPFALGYTEYSTIQEMRDYYKNLLNTGFKTA